MSCLYHEATFLDTHQDLAVKTKYSTAEEAAQVAAKAEVGQLILGHFSSRYPDLNAFIEQAQRHFQNVHLAEDGRGLLSNNIFYSDKFLEIIHFEVLHHLK